MYETRTPLRPVKSLIKYLYKRNTKCESLWQRPSDSFIVIDSGIWFERKPLGKHTLDEYM
jgi:hypothetical protein